MERRRQLARKSGVPALFVDYALSGTAPYPRALDQTLAVVSALRERGVTRIVLAGDSAGGGLSIAVAARLRDAGEPAAGLIVVSPWVDVTLADEASAAFDGSDIILGLDSLRASGRAYAGSHDPRDPDISPLFGDPAGLPPVILHVGDAEMFLPDDTRWSTAVAAAGGQIEWHVIPGGFHVSAILAFTPEGRRARREQLAFLRRTLP